VIYGRVEIKTYCRYKSTASGRYPLVESRLVSKTPPAVRSAGRIWCTTDAETARAEQRHCRYCSAIIPAPHPSSNYARLCHPPMSNAGGRRTHTLWNWFHSDEDTH